MNTAAKIQNMGEQNNSPLIIAHRASATPFYYVEEAEINGRKVWASFFNENDPDSEIETTKIPVKDLIGFIDDTYGDYINTGYSEERLLDTRSPFDYLCDNLNRVVTEFINVKGVCHD